MKYLPFLTLGVILIYTGSVLDFAALGAEPTGTAPSNQVEMITLASSPRTQVDFDCDWRFSKGDFPTAAMSAFNDSTWRRVNLPHDWSIEGPFSPDYASSTGYAPGGIGWYRKHFRVDSSAKGKIVMIEFDGVYDHSEVWVNGHFVGGRPYGYSSFECDLTPHLKFGSEDNVVAVRADHSRFADSRWYTGSGIYRHVRLRITDRLRIAHWGTYVTTPEVKENSAVIRIETTVENNAGTTRKLSLQSEIITPDGRVAGNLITNGSLDNNTNQSIVQQITIERPQPWTLEAPRLYTLRSRLSVDSTAVDETTTAFGVRTLRFDPNNGFFLNGTPMKLKGVCIHHDAGCLGAAVPEKVLERRLRLLKELGVNAIRTSHNPPAPELLDLCDRLGLLVKDEAFDEFTPAKNKWVTGRNNGLPARFGYAENFEEWSVRDIQDMVRRDRNHPSVILWSIGNEIDYANDPFSHPILGKEYHPENPPAENLVKHARPLIEAVKTLDRTRPVTAALANVAMSDAVGLGELLDVVGYNYQESRYPSDHAKYPQRFIFGSENRHPYADWAVVRDNDYVAGQFLWTGIDYLGEANRWPNRGSGAGLLDLCGFKKPLAWFRQSLWSDQPMVYLCAASEDGSAGRGRMRGEESWNWPSNSTTSITVRCFTTCPEVALTLNDKTLGTKKLSEATDGALIWRVPFEPGVLKAVGRQGDKPVCEFVLKTAGAASRIELLPDVTQLSADGKDVCHVEFRIVDSQGVRVPDAGNELTFELDGPAEILGIENGDLNSPESYQTRTHKAYHGRGLAILQSSTAAGRITLTATSPGMDPASVILNSK
jgi:beta-galactosidase